MERFYSQTIGSEIFTENAIYMGRVSEIVVDPDRGMIVGFLTGSLGEKAFSPIDLLSWNRQLIVKDEESLLDTEEIIKIREVLEAQNMIMKKKVVTKSGQYIGKVSDIAFDSLFLVMTKIFVAKPLLFFFEYDERIFTVQQILEIKKDVIIVKDPEELIPFKEEKNRKNTKKIRPIPTPTNYIVPEKIVQPIY